MQEETTNQFNGPRSRTMQRSSFWQLIPCMGYISCAQSPVDANPLTTTFPVPPGVLFKFMWLWNFKRYFGMLLFFAVKILWYNFQMYLAR